MDPTNTGAIYCQHELERRRLTPRTLHEKMMVEAEPIIQHNWTDVAIHDKAKLQKIPVGQYCYWIVGQMGSYLSPAFCNIDERHRWTTSPIATLSPVQLLFARWHGQAYRFQDSVAWGRVHDPVIDKHCYLIVKTDSTRGEVTPITYKELADMVVYGKRQMVR